jgi:serine phosphatase RsbU (regulator of sigma subunit)
LSRLTVAHSPDGLEFGPERLDSICRHRRHTGVEEILDAVFEALEEFVGSRRQQDDIAAAALKVL